MNSHKVIIVGSGPAGLTAAIYAARADLKPLLIAGVSYGGQLMLTSEVGNYPGFAEDILGSKLMEEMVAQAKRFGTEMIFEDVTRVNFLGSSLRVFCGEREYEALSVIIATGASAKWLGLPSEEKLRGKGVSACATCDGFFFKDKKVAVLGGGDTAMEEAIYLTKFASEVTVVHRRDTLRASKIMQKRARENPKIKFVWDSIVEEILGEEMVRGLRIRNLKTSESSELEVQGVFVAIGHEPNTKFLQGSGLNLDEKGYVAVEAGGKTNVSGVFAAGDVHDHIYRQAITAAGAGCRAAMEAERYLSGIN